MTNNDHRGDCAVLDKQELAWRGEDEESEGRIEAILFAISAQARGTLKDSGSPTINGSSPIERTPKFHPWKRFLGSG